MLRDESRGICFAAPDIRARIQQGLISGSPLDEQQIQPSSFEPTLEDEIFVLDTDRQGVIRPLGNESVYRTLLKLPGRVKKKT